jgi:hypothetical protein
MWDFLSSLSRPSPIGVALTEFWPISSRSLVTLTKTFFDSANERVKRCLKLFADAIRDDQFPGDRGTLGRSAKRIAKSAIVLSLFITLHSYASAQTTYTFTKIAETSDNSQVFGVASYLSDTGSVAYALYTITPYPNSVTKLSLPAAYVSQRGVVRRLGDSSLPSVVLDINGLGSIVFNQLTRALAPL